MRFEHTGYFLGLVAIPALIILFYLLLRWKKGTARKIGDAQLVSQLVSSYSPVQFFLKFIVILFALSAIVLGMANFQKRGKSENLYRRGVDVMLLLDVSKSMLAEDVRPSRLDKAKQFLLKLTDRLTDDRVGLILFAGRAYMQMPLTIDQSAAKMYIQNAGPDVVPTQGTVIADALRMANGSFSATEHKFKAVVLISDGEDHDPDALKTAKQLADDGVMINTLGVGSAEGATIIDPITRETKKDENGQIVISRLNEQELSQLADLTNGIYMRLDNVEAAVITISQRLDEIEKKALEDSDYIQYTSYFQWFLAAALFFLLLEFLLPERKFSVT